MSAFSGSRFIYIAMLQETITKALSDIGLPSVAFSVERPASLDHGDFSTNVALIVSSQSHQPAKEIARTLTESLNRKFPTFEGQKERDLDSSTFFFHPTRLQKK